MTPGRHTGGGQLAGSPWCHRKGFGVNGHIICLNSVFVFFLSLLVRQVLAFAWGWTWKVIHPPLSPRSWDYEYAWLVCWDRVPLTSCLG
jgi:hypothetical protein